MTPLAQLQREFLAQVLDEDGDASPGVAVYRRTVLANLHAALASTYPVVRRLVGDAFFREAARRYAQAHPSASGNLHLYGSELAEFLAAYAFARELPYLADVARLEWACHESFHAGAAPDFDPAPLAAIAPQRHGDIRFRIHPAVRLVSSPYPVMSIWEANQPERDGTPEASAGAEHVIVRREALEVRLARATAAEWRFVASLARGETLAAAFDHAGGDADFLAPFLARLAAQSVIAGFIGPESGA
jgi:hypothetical protein